MDIERDPIPLRRIPPQQIPEDLEKSSGETIMQNQFKFNGGSSRRKGRVLIEYQFLSAIVDGLIILGGTLLFCFLFMLYLKTDLHIFSGYKNTTFIKIFAVMFFWFQFCYLVLLRSFLGFTLGEKTFKLRLGTLHEQRKLLFPLNVILRTLFILLTGVVTFPILSWIFKSDLSGEICGLKLQSLI